MITINGFNWTNEANFWDWIDDQRKNENYWVQELIRKELEDYYRQKNQMLLDKLEGSKQGA